MFDYIHILLFVVALLSGYWKLGNQFLAINPIKYPKESKKYSLEKILGLTIISLFWIFYGVYKNINENFIILEVFTFCILLLIFISKINFLDSATIFGHKIFGHGKSETKIQKIIKYILLILVILSPIIYIIVVNITSSY